MSLMTLLLMLLVAAAVIYGVRLALAGQWKELIIMVVMVMVALWILGAFGISIPNFP